LDCNGEPIVAQPQQPTRAKSATPADEKPALTPDAGMPKPLDTEENPAPKGLKAVPPMSNPAPSSDVSSSKST
jgi:hypothetical protein